MKIPCPAVCRDTPGSGAVLVCGLAVTRDVVRGGLAEALEGPQAHLPRRMMRVRPSGT